MIELLSWDTDFFGYSVGKIEVQDKDFLPSFDSHFRLIYVFSKNKIDELEHSLVDRKATFVCSIKQFSEVNRKMQIEPFDPVRHDYNELIGLTLESGVYSRFFVDENFVNGEYEKLYTRWIDNSITGLFPFTVYVAIANGKLVGFITLSNKEGLADIGLLAVSKEARGKGVATELITYVKNIAYENGLNTMQVVTQLDNSPAIKLYESQGFILNELVYIYHIWNHDTI